MRGRRILRPSGRRRRRLFSVCAIACCILTGAGAIALRPEGIGASFTSTASTASAFTAGALTGVDAPASGVSSFAASPTVGGCDVSWTGLAGGTAVADRLEVTDDARSVTSTAAGSAAAGSASDVPVGRGVLYRLRSRVGTSWVSPDAENRFALCSPLGSTGIGPGRFMSCALDMAGAWWCWGLAPMQTVSNVPVKIDAGPYREVGSWGTSVACAIRTDSTLWCFGTGSSGQLGQGTTTDSPTPVQVTSSTSWRQLGNGGDHVCATRTDDSLWCWGSNGYGQLGDGTTTNRTSPTQVSPGAAWLRVWSTDRTTCALRRDGTAWCWGGNSYGAVGNGSTGATVKSPSQVGTATDWVQLAPDRYHTCGLRSDGSLWCWGANARGELGDGTTTDRLTPVQVGAGQTWIQVSSFLEGSCALRADRTLWCWGQTAGGRSGQVGQYLVGGVTVPSQVGTDADWVSLVSGALHSCATKADRTVWCWGDDRTAELGNDAGLLVTPRQVTTGAWTTSVSTGATVSCGVRPDTSLWCWGRNNSNGSYPDPTPALAEVPVPYKIGASGWSTVSVGGSHGCGLRTDNSLWCWGYDSWGEAGQGTTAPVTAPVQVGSATWTDVRAGNGHTCGLQSDGSLWCWGYNADGRLGDGTTTPRSTPVRIGAATWSKVATGANHTCGIQTDGTLWCWGSGGNGQIGDGTGTTQTAPVRIGTSTWSAVSAGAWFTCGVRTDGTLWCWGANSLGQLADGATTDQAAPVQVGTSTAWQSVLAGYATACALRTDATLWCWGSNYSGQAGQGTFTTVAAPAQVLTGVGDLTAASGTVGSSTLVTKVDGTLWSWGRNDQHTVGIGGYSDVPTQLTGGATWAR